MRRALLPVVTAFVVAITIAPAIAQESVAEIQTWRGDSFRISQPALDSLYSIIPRALIGANGAPVAGAAGAAAETGVSAPPAGSGPQASIIGSARSLAGLFGQGPPPIQGRASHHALTFVRSGVETRVPFDRISGLTVERKDLASTLPPYVSATHAQYAATAVLVDGSTIQADYVNFGTIILRGTGPQGSIELPLEDVRTLKITR